MKNIVFIPIYKDDFNEAEMISLNQGRKIFKDEIVCFIAPKKLKKSKIRTYNIPIICFDDKYFINVDSYSQLMLSVNFYKRFQDYDYMLIYQLDAFVFSNRLQEFSLYKYDYIGACIPACYWPFLDHRVGNGGFSLRNIKRCIKILLHKEEILNLAAKKLEPSIYRQISTVEDIFFSYCGNQEDIDFSLAPIEIAQNFSVEYEVNGRYKTLKDNMPFGCHRWYQASLNIWWPYIHKMGYYLSDSFQKNYFTKPILSIDYNLLQWVDDLRYCRIIKNVLLKKITNKEIIIWGFGLRGKKLLYLLKKIGILPVCIFDTNYSIEKIYENILYMPPDFSEIIKSNRIVIVTPYKFQQEIISELEKMGVNTNEYCLMYDELIRYIMNYVNVVDS